MVVPNRNLLFEGSILGFHVSFREYTNNCRKIGLKKNVPLYLLPPSWITSGSELTSFTSNTSPYDFFKLYILLKSSRFETWDLKKTTILPHNTWWSCLITHVICQNNSHFIPLKSTTCWNFLVIFLGYLTQIQRMRCFRHRNRLVV